MANINLDLTTRNVFEKSKDTRTYTYRDIGTKNFKVNYDKNNNITVNTTDTSLYDKQAVKNAIWNIFAFIPGQEILDPNFGCSIYRFLYIPLSEQLGSNLKRQLVSMLTQYEPRIEIKDIKLELNSDECLADIKLYYIINGLLEEYTIDVSEI